ncbi:MAG: hypothetical protein J6C00_05635 [Eubacterium sp.]|nr:hypothetical protein [Eubacterium sp.]
MNISGIGSYSGNYNSIKINSLINQQASKADSGAQTQAVRSEDSALRQQEQQRIRANQNFNSADYAKQFTPGKTYEMKGADSDLASLDESRSTTNSQKSQIMQQYQLFMGETQAQGVNQTAMNTQAVRGVENFAF